MRFLNCYLPRSVTISFILDSIFLFPVIESIYSVVVRSSEVNILLYPTFSPPPPPTAVSLDLGGAALHPDFPSRPFKPILNFSGC